MATSSDQDYSQKLADLQKYVPFLESMIKHLKSTKEKSREAQLAKMERLYSMITDKNKKWKYDTLLKCEEVIEKLQSRMTLNLPADASDKCNKEGKTTEDAIKESKVGERKKFDTKVSESIKVDKEKKETVVDSNSTLGIKNKPKEHKSKESDNSEDHREEIFTMKPFKNRFSYSQRHRRGGKASKQNVILPLLLEAMRGGSSNDCADIPSPEPDFYRSYDDKIDSARSRCSPYQLNDLDLETEENYNYHNDNTRPGCSRFSATPLSVDYHEYSRRNRDMETEENYKYHNDSTRAGFGRFSPPPLNDDYHEYSRGNSREEWYEDLNYLNFFDNEDQYQGHEVEEKHYQDYRSSPTTDNYRRYDQNFEKNTGYDKHEWRINEDYHQNNRKFFRNRDESYRNENNFRDTFNRRDIGDNLNDGNHCEKFRSANTDRDPSTFHKNFRGIEENKSFSKIGFVRKNFEINNDKRSENIREAESSKVEDLSKTGYVRKDPRIKDDKKSEDLQEEISSKFPKDEDLSKIAYVRKDPRIKDDNRSEDVEEKSSKFSRDEYISKTGYLRRDPRIKTYDNVFSVKQNDGGKMETVKDETFIKVDVNHSIESPKSLNCHKDKAKEISEDKHCVQTLKSVVDSEKLYILSREGKPSKFYTNNAKNKPLKQNEVEESLNNDVFLSKHIEDNSSKKLSLKSCENFKTEVSKKDIPKHTSTEGDKNLKQETIKDCKTQDISEIIKNEVTTYTKYDKIYSNLVHQNTFTSPLESLYSEGTTTKNFKIPKKQNFFALKKPETKEKDSFTKKGNNSKIDDKKQPVKADQSVKEKALSKIRTYSKKNKSKRTVSKNSDEEDYVDISENHKKKKYINIIEDSDEEVEDLKKTVENIHQESDKKVKAIGKPTINQNELAEETSRTKKTVTSQDKAMDTEQVTKEDVKRRKSVFSDEEKSKKLKAANEKPSDCSTTKKSSLKVEIKDEATSVDEKLSSSGLINTNNFSKSNADLNKKLTDAVVIDKKESTCEEVKNKPVVDAKELAKEEVLNEVNKNNLQQSTPTDVLEFILKNYKHIKKIFDSDSSSDEENIKKKKKKKKKRKKYSSSSSSSSESEDVKSKKLKVDETNNKENETKELPKEDESQTDQTKKTELNVVEVDSKQNDKDVQIPPPEKEIPKKRTNVEQKPRKNELDILHEDIKEMWMCGDIIRATGRRACTINKVEIASPTVQPKKNVSVKEMTDKAATLRILVMREDFSKLFEKNSIKVTDFSPAILSKKLQKLLGKKRNSSVNEDKLEESETEVYAKKISSRTKTASGVQSTKANPSQQSSLNEDRLEETETEVSAKKVFSRKKAASVNKDVAQSPKANLNQKSLLKEDKLEETEAEICAKINSPRKKTTSVQRDVVHSSKANISQQSSLNEDKLEEIRAEVCTQKTSLIKNTACTHKDVVEQSSVNEDKLEEIKAKVSTKKASPRKKIVYKEANQSPEESQSQHHDKYYFVCNERTSCRFCPFKGKLIVAHYKTKHRNYEVLVSRIDPLITERLIEDSYLNHYESVVLHEGPREKYSYICPFCTGNLIVDYTSQFYDHITSHTGEYRYCCDECNYSWYTSNCFNHHYTKHNKSVKPAPRPPPFSSLFVFGYVCKECHYMQTLRENLEKHVQFYHDNRAEIIKINLNLIGLGYHQDHDAIANPLNSANENEETYLTASSFLEVKIEEPEGTNVDNVEKNVCDNDAALKVEDHQIQEGCDTTQPNSEESKKSNETNLTAFICETDIEDKKIEEKRLEKMNEILENVKIPRTSIVDKLQNKLVSTESETASLKVCTNQLSTQSDLNSSKTVPQKPKPSRAFVSEPKRSENFTATTLESNSKEPEILNKTRPLNISSQMIKWTEESLKNHPILSSKIVETIRESAFKNAAPSEVVSWKKSTPISSIINRLQDNLHPNPYQKSSTVIENTCDTLPVGPQNVVITTVNDIPKNDSLNLLVGDSAKNQNCTPSETAIPKLSSTTNSLQSSSHYKKLPAEANPGSILESVLSKTDQMIRKTPQSKQSMKKFVTKMKNRNMPLLDTSSIPMLSNLDVSNKTKDDSLPPLSHYKNYSTNKEKPEIVLHAGPIKVLKRKNGNILYACFVPLCVFCTDKAGVFEVHCKVTHAKNMYEFFICTRCNMKFGHRGTYQSLHDIFVHIQHKHSNFFVKDKTLESTVTSETFANSMSIEDDMSMSAVDNIENISSRQDSNLILQNNTADSKYRFVITSVRSLAKESQPTSSAPSNNVSISTVSIPPKPSETLLNTSTSRWSYDDPPPLINIESESSSLIKNSLSSTKKTYIRPVPLFKLLASEDNVENSNTKASDDGPKKNLENLYVNPLELPPKSVYETYSAINPAKIAHFYKCPEINCKFSSFGRNNFVLHLAQHPDNNVFCLYCGSLVLISTYVAHLENFHAACRYACSHCYYRASSATFVKVHIEMNHKNEKKVMTVATPVETLPPKAMESYNLPPIKNLVKPYICGEPDCSMKTIFGNLFLEHYYVVHKQTNKMTCGYCHDKLIKAVLPHFWAIHDIYPYHCRYCPEGSHKVQTIIEHQATVHNHLPFCLLYRKLRVTDKNSTDSSDEYDKIVILTEESLNPKYKNINVKNVETCTTKIIKDGLLDETTDAENSEPKATFTSDIEMVDVDETEISAGNKTPVENEPDPLSLDDTELIEFTCSECCGKFNTENDLNAHTCTSTKQKTTTTSSTNLAETETTTSAVPSTKSNPVKRKLCCSMCSFKFDDRESAENHMRTVHNITETVLAAIQPSDSGNSEVPLLKQFLNSSSNQYYDGTFYPFCKICGPQVASLRCTHLKKESIYHKNRITPALGRVITRRVVCNEKAKVVSRLRILVHTIVTPQFIGSNRYFCGGHRCYRIFQTEWNFKLHLYSVHNQERTFICRHCNVKVEFRTQKINIELILKHFQLHGPTLYRCSYCYFLDNTAKMTEKHIAEIHPSKPLKIRVLREKEKISSQSSSSEDQTNSSLPKEQPSTATTKLITAPKKSTLTDTDEVVSLISEIEESSTNDADCEIFDPADIIVLSNSEDESDDCEETDLSISENLKQGNNSKEKETSQPKILNHTFAKIKDATLNEQTSTQIFSIPEEDVAIYNANVVDVSEEVEISSVANNEDIDEGENEAELVELPSDNELDLLTCNNTDNRDCVRKGFVQPDGPHIKPTMDCYKCPLCNSTTMFAKKFFQHLERKSDLIKEKFLDNDATSESVAEWIRSFVIYQTKIMNFWKDTNISTERACRFCPLVCYRSSCYKHEVKHFIIKPLVCPYCDHGCLNKEAIDIHISNVHKDVTLTHEDNCPDAFPLKPAISATINDMFLMEIMEEADFENSEESLVSAARQLNSCFYCNFVGSYLEQREHYKEKHPRKEVLGFMFKCNDCRYSYFETMKLFIRHNNSAHGGNAKYAADYIGSVKYQCNECNKAFYDERLYRLHVRVHYKTYKCMYCAYNTYSWRCLRKHYFDLHRDQEFQYLYDFLAEHNLHKLLQKQVDNRLDKC